MSWFVSAPLDHCDDGILFSCETNDRAFESYSRLFARSGLSGWNDSSIEVSSADIVASVWRDVVV